MTNSWRYEFDLLSNVQPDTSTAAAAAGTALHTSLAQCFREKSPVLSRGRGRAPNISVPSVAPGASRAFMLAAMCSRSAQPT